ncbi:ribonuclease domain-containing protein [Streptomyces sp. GC420]|uniref:ribonuclease domain-containing protein n=1 Tax=Streptomyces sp. GC420 TaxID=2697568 RepID=UPI001414DE6E|nr:ribonuclease domain-containing protein [Streptomyces sp. GC420]NBM15278.1 ribonuclease [Streptomyces sp. GC420]
MRIPPRITRLGAAGALVTSLLVGGALTAPTTAVAAPTSAPATLTVAVAAADYGGICYGDLPSQAYDTLELIARGGPFPYSQDGSVFQNREGLLPAHSTGYYHEYTVKTPGVSTRGARRIVTGQAYEEDYYTSDHYASFDLIDYDC